MQNKQFNEKLKRFYGQVHGGRSGRVSKARHGDAVGRRMRSIDLTWGNWKDSILCLSSLHMRILLIRDQTADAQGSGPTRHHLRPVQTHGDGKWPARSEKQLDSGTTALLSSPTAPNAFVERPADKLPRNPRAALGQPASLVRLERDLQPHANVPDPRCDAVRPVRSAGRGSPIARRRSCRLFGREDGARGRGGGEVLVSSTDAPGGVKFVLLP